MLLLSIRPSFAEPILEGRKQVEFRRRQPRQIEFGSRMLIYASSPTRALIGTAVVVDVLEASPEKIWAEYRNVGGIAHDEFNAYFDSSDRAVAIRLRTPVRFDKAISLKELRCKWPGFHPPQQVAYLTSDRLREIAGFVDPP